MKAMLLGTALAGLVTALMYATPVDANDTHETSAITQDDLKAAYAAGYADRDDQDVAFEDGWLAGAQDALEEPTDAISEIERICESKGGVVAEDMSCIENPDEYWHGTSVDIIKETYGLSDADCSDCITEADWITAAGESGKKVDKVGSLPNTGGTY